MAGIILCSCLINTVLLVVIVFLLLKNRQSKQKHTTNPKHDTGTCDASTCGATDPVSDPDYNMREIAKQSILLEEHLSVDAKFCRDCVTKHFLHIIGLANEAVMLAGAKADTFPLLVETGPTYESLLEQWLKTRDLAPDQARTARLAVAGSMRDFRKQIIVVYFAQNASSAMSILKDNFKL